MNNHLIFAIIGASNDNTMTHAEKLAKLTMMSNAELVVAALRYFFVDHPNTVPVTVFKNLILRDLVMMHSGLSHNAMLFLRAIIANPREKYLSDRYRAISECRMQIISSIIDIGHKSIDHEFIAQCANIITSDTFRNTLHALMQGTASE
jgi:hypothetical protein